MIVCVVKRENRNEDQRKECQGKTDNTGEKGRSRKEDPKLKNVRKSLWRLLRYIKMGKGARRRAGDGFWGGGMF